MVRLQAGKNLAAFRFPHLRGDGPIQPHLQAVQRQLKLPDSDSYKSP